MKYYELTISDEAAPVILPLIVTEEDKEDLMKLAKIALANGYTVELKTKITEESHGRS